MEEGLTKIHSWVKMTEAIMLKEQFSETEEVFLKVHNILSGVISLPNSWFLPIQFRNGDLLMFVNTIVIKRQANFYYSKKYAQHFLFQPFSIILTFSRFKHQNYVSFTTRVSESTHCKVVALVSARSTAVVELKTASVPPTLSKGVGQIKNLYWSFF